MFANSLMNNYNGFTGKIDDLPQYQEWIQQRIQNEKIAATNLQNTILRLNPGQSTGTLMFQDQQPSIYFSGVGDVSNLNTMKVASNQWADFDPKRGQPFSFNLQKTPIEPEKPKSPQKGLLSGTLVTMPDGTRRLQVGNSAAKVQSELNSSSCSLESILDSIPRMPIEDVTSLASSTSSVSGEQVESTPQPVNPICTPAPFQYGSQDKKIEISRVTTAKYVVPATFGPGLVGWSDRTGCIWCDKKCNGGNIVADGELSVIFGQTIERVDDIGDRSLCMCDSMREVFETSHLRGSDLAMHIYNMKRYDTKFFNDNKQIILRTQAISKEIKASYKNRCMLDQIIKDAEAEMKDKTVKYEICNISNTTKYTFVLRFVAAKYKWQVVSFEKAAKVQPIPQVQKAEPLIIPSVLSLQHSHWKQQLGCIWCNSKCIEDKDIKTRKVYAGEAKTLQNDQLISLDSSKGTLWCCEKFREMFSVTGLADNEVATRIKEIKISDADFASQLSSTRTYKLNVNNNTFVVEMMKVENGWKTISIDKKERVIELVYAKKEKKSVMQVLTESVFKRQN